MVERVSTTPQVGGRNLSELVQKRASQQQLVSSVSGPPAAANVPKAPDPEPIDPPKVPDRDDAIERAQKRVQQTQATTPNIRRAVQIDTSAQVRQLIGNAIRDAAQGGGPPAQTLNAASAAGVASQPPAPAPPDPAPATPNPPVDISLVGTTRPGGDIETQTIERRPPAVAENTAPNPAPAVDAPAPETAPAVELQPQAEVPDVLETSEQENGQNSGGNSELRGDVVNIVA